jgi:predicted dehydrogenase
MQPTRRTALAALGAASYMRLKGANERIQVGFIGYGLIGAQHVSDFRGQSDCDLVALSDCYQPRLEQGLAACGSLCKGYADFRRLLDQKDIDAVVVSTPDHWHALMAMMACAAGKDVYVEKPLTLFVKEGRWMTEVARRHKRVVQAGTQQRSGLHYAKARKMIRDGYIGSLTSTRISYSRNIMPGYGAPPDGTVPAGFDYSMWLGPAPERPYNPKRGIYHFRWFWDYSGGQMSNLGAHDLDIVHWVTGVNGPAAVSSSGGRLGLKSAEDNGETPDTQSALFEYPGFITEITLREVSGGRREAYDLELYGTKGSVALSRAGFEVTCDPKRDPSQTIPTFKGHPTGGPRGNAERREAEPAPKEFWCTNVKEPGSSAEQFTLHVRNFLECIRSREKPVADVEDAHRVAAACHLANLSLRTGKKLRYDPEREEIIGDAEAAAMLTRPYRAPWDRELRALIT